MKCHKCQKEMTMTPVCSECGIIPIADASFRQRDDEIKRLRYALEKIANWTGGTECPMEIARKALSANARLDRQEEAR
jgi:hypothetical protein